MFWNALSPASFRPISFPRPPFDDVCICMFGDIQLMPPLSVITDSPFSR